MNGELVYLCFFYLLASSAVLLSLGVVCDSRLLRSAISLVGVLGCSVGLSLMLGFEFVAGIQVLVFIGGIVVLLLFGIMMTSDGNAFEKSPTMLRKILAGITSLGFFFVTTSIFVTTDFALAGRDEAPTKNVEEIGKKLLSNDQDGYILPFEVISLLLLAALISGIVIARKKTAEEE